MSRPIEGKYSQSRHPGMQRLESSRVRLESSRVRDDQRLPRATQRPSRYIQRGKAANGKLDFANPISQLFIRISRLPGFRIVS